MTPRQKIAALEDFVGEHGYTVTNCLQVYASHMREDSAQTMASWEAIKDNPEAAAKQDKTLMTTNGLYQSAVMFRQAAESAERALAAWEELTEPDDE